MRKGKRMRMMVVVLYNRYRQVPQLTKSRLRNLIVTSIANHGGVRKRDGPTVRGEHCRRWSGLAMGY